MKRCFCAVMIVFIVVAAGCHKKEAANPATVPGDGANAVTDDGSFKFTISTDEDEGDVEIPVLVSSVHGKYTVLYDLDCDGDGQYELKSLTGKAKCVYKGRSGDHQIRVHGELPSIRLCPDEGRVWENDWTGNQNVISVDDWGDINWKSMNSFAKNCAVLDRIPESAPNLAEVSDMRHMFKGARKFNEPLEKWDVSKVTNMSGMFAAAHEFNQPLEKWDVSHVTDMSGMFESAWDFNQPLEKWDVSHVTNMSGMFESAWEFNQPLEKWDVSNVTDMSWMFGSEDVFDYPPGSFNQPLEKWNVSNVTNMSWMFAGTSVFNQPLEKWDVSKVTNMSGMFAAAHKFNQPLEKWDVSNVTDMSWMFAVRQDPADLYGIMSKFDQPLEKWDVSNVTDMAGMFSGAVAFDQPLEKWNVSKVTDMSQMFAWADSFNQPLEKWDVSQVRSMFRMFYGAETFNQPLEKWNVSNVTNMAWMFSCHSHEEVTEEPDVQYAFNQPLEKWDVSHVEDMSGMFYGARSFNQSLKKWNVSSVKRMYKMFFGATAFSYYPSSWIVPEYEYEIMFEGTKVSALAQEKKLQTKKIESNEECPTCGLYYKEDPVTICLGSHYNSCFESFKMSVCSDLQYDGRAMSEADTLYHDRLKAYCTCYGKCELEIGCYELADNGEREQCRIKNADKLEQCGSVCQKERYYEKDHSVSIFSSQCSKGVCMTKCDANANQKTDEDEKSCVEQCLPDCMKCTLGCKHDELYELLYGEEFMGCDACEGKY